MKKSANTLLPLLALAAGPLSVSVLAQDNGALLDALVQEGVLKESKAEQIRAKLAGDYAKTTAGKIKLDSAFQEIKVNGDARFRYQWQESQAQAGGATDAKRSLQRERIRLRLGADFKLTDQFFGGFQLSTGQTSDSDNQTVGSTGQGAGFGKFPVYISKAFLGWEPIKGLTGVLGKQPNPFYTNDQGLVWDADINPTGLSEKFELHKLLGWVGPWELSFTAGQFVLADNNEGYLRTTNGTDKATDALLFQVQAQVGFKFDDSHKLTVAPGFLTYNAASTSNVAASTSAYSAEANGASFGADNGTRGLQLLLLPGDFSTRIGGLKTKFVWDFSYNLDGAARAYEVYGLNRNGNATTGHKSNDDYAWLLGVVVGENKKKGDFSFLANYRQTGLTAVDPNLNDSDFAESKLNTKGFKVGVNYNLSQSVVLSLAYQNAFNLRNQLDTTTLAAPNGQNTTTTGLKTLADRNNVQILQADVTVKF